MRLVTSVGLAVALAACGGSPVAPGGGGGPVQLDPSVRNATLDAPSGQEVLTAPDTVRAGAVFTVSFWMVEGGCKEPLADAVDQELRSVTVTPYVRFLIAAGEVCPPYDRLAQHSVDVFLGGAGVDTVRAVGYVPGADGQVTLGSVERVVVVTP